ncbi:MAG: hypothetical protein GY765_14615 [bacterium]|nr:hypothetical protein [bacterium]
MGKFETPIPSPDTKTKRKRKKRSRKTVKEKASSRPIGDNEYRLFGLQTHTCNQ